MKAIIFAAGRGQRMRPLSDQCPKPLLKVGGKPLITWHIEKLVQAGITEIVINYSWLGEQFPRILGNGSYWGAKLYYSAEQSALETAGGIAHALPLLGDGIFLAISGDIYTNFDFANLHLPAQLMCTSIAPKMYLVLVDNPEFHPQGDFGLKTKKLVDTTSCTEISLTETPFFTYANIGLYDTRSFNHLDPHQPAKLRPLLDDAIIQGRVNGEYFRGIWYNVGTPEQLYELDKLLKNTE